MQVTAINKLLLCRTNCRGGPALKTTALPAHSLNFTPLEPSDMSPCGQSHFDIAPFESLLSMYKETPYPIGLLRISFEISKLRMSPSFYPCLVCLQLANYIVRLIGPFSTCVLCGLHVSNLCPCFCHVLTFLNSIGKNMLRI